MTYHLRSINTFQMRISSTSYFGYTAPLLQRPDHRLFASVDWDRVEGGEYAIVDPLDPSGILYLPERDYIIQTRVSQAQGYKPVILATPRDKRPSGSSNNNSSSDPNTSDSQSTPFGSYRDIKRRFAQMFSHPFKFVQRVRHTAKHGDVVENLVVVEQDTLVPLFRVWALHLHRRIAGLGSHRVLLTNVLQFGRFLYHVYRFHGVNHLIKRLKLYLFVINSYLSGNKLTETTALGFRVRLSNGLPKALPVGVRQSLRARNKVTILIWSSLLYVFRAMEGRHSPPSLSVITQKLTMTPEYIAEEARFREFCEKFAKWICSLAKVPQDEVFMELRAKDLHKSSSAGPHSGWSLTSIPQDTLYWVLKGMGQGSILFDYLRETRSLHLASYFQSVASKLLTRLVGQETATKALQSEAEALGAVQAAYEAAGASGSVKSWSIRTGTRRNPNICAKELICGRLHALKEAAGKVRIIAIVDIWTQSALRPMHDFLFKLLRALKTDGTFDQQSAVNSFAQLGHKDIYSYDLTAATDTIPYRLYEVVMTPILGAPITKAWLALLRDRDWLTPTWDFPRNTVKSAAGKATRVVKTVQKRIRHQGSTTIRYGRGQPMGALSSWGALAVLHHAVLQYAAFRVGSFPYTDYRVLGDDIVIAGTAVAESYREVCGRLGILIGLPKSFTSCEGFFNFASQSFIGPHNISPFSLADELAANGLSGRLASVRTAVARGLLDPTSPNFFARLCRYVLPPAVVKRVEAARRLGQVHNAVHYVSGLVFSSVLQGASLFGDKVKGLTSIEIGSALLRVGLSLFSLNLEAYASSVAHSDQELSNLYAFQQLVLKEFKTSLGRLRGRLIAAGSLLSTPPIAPLCMGVRGIPIPVPTSTDETDLEAPILWDEDEIFKDAVKELKDMDIQVSDDTLLSPLEEVNDQHDMYEYPRWILDFQLGCSLIWPKTLRLGHSEYVLDNYVTDVLDTFSAKFTKNLLGELIVLSRRHQTMEHSPTGNNSMPVDERVVRQLKLAEKKLPQDINSEERSAHLLKLRTILITQARRELEGLRAFVIETNRQLDHSALSYLLDQRVSEKELVHDRSLMALLALAVKTRERESKVSRTSREAREILAFTPG